MKRATQRILVSLGATLPVLGALAAPPADAAIITRWDANNLALSNGTAVGSWSSNAGAFTLTASGTNQPTYQSVGMNGRPSVRYDGTDDVMKAGAAVNNAKTVVVVTTAATGSASLSTLISTGGDSRNVRIDGTTDFYRSEGHNGDNNDFYRVDAAVTGNDGVYVNNVLSGGFTRDVGHVVLSESDTANSYTDFWVGSASTALGRYWKGDVGEIIVFDNALTADERAGVARNLSVKWNFATPISANQSQIDAANALGVLAPEPGAAGLAAVAGLGLLARRRRRSA
jgi:hypothetical protein